MSNLRYLLWVGLLIAGFFVGVAWKNKDQGQAPSAQDTKSVPVSYESKSTLLEANPALNPSEIATIQLFERASPSVCFINTTALSQDFWTRDVTEIPRGSGSGFVWDKEGHIVTNFHVIQGANRATVTLSDRTTYDAAVVGTYPEKDMAVLRIDAPANKLTPIPVGESENLRVGQSVYAIGNPFGLDQTLTTGVVSALGREIESVAGVPIRDVIQSDAAINPGNSGGPLLNSSGQLIGVNTAIYSPSGASAGIGFSIPVDAVKWVIPEIIRYGKVQRPTIGVTIAPQQVVDRLGIDQGALVVGVEEGSAAARAGIRPTYRSRTGEIILGDVITKVNNETIKNGSEITLALEKLKAGQTISVQVMRDGKPTNLQVKLDQPR